MFRIFLGGCSWFSWDVPGFLGVFRVFWGCSGFSSVPECSVMFRDVPVFRVPVFLEVLHTKIQWLTSGTISDSADCYMHDFQYV